MDLRTYFQDLRRIAAELERKFGDSGVVYVTSKFYRERNSTEGSTASATCWNAARVITDGTHRESSDEEIQKFLQHQQDELEKNIRSEQAKKQQYVVVTGNTLDSPLRPVNATVIPGQRGRPVPLAAQKDEE